MEKVVELGDQLAEVQAIGVSGSQARGRVDAFSDVDICIFVRGDYPAAEIRRQAYADLGFGEPIYFDVDFDTSWGDGFRVEKIRFDFNWMVIENVRNSLANLTSDFNCAEWLPGGLATIKTLHDPQNLIQQLQREILLYPEARARHRVQQALQEAHFSLFELEWLPKAAYRGDAFSFLKYQYFLVEKLFYALFALNQVWFSDEKRLTEHITGFEAIPKNAGARIQALILYQDGNEKFTDNLANLKALFKETTVITQQRFPNLDLPLDWD
jgi:hypothetical protein